VPAHVHQGAKAPEAYVLNVVPGDSGVDLSTVSAASFSVRLHGGTETTWAATRSNQTATTLKLTHTFDSGGTETAIVGDYVVYAVLTIPSGTVRTEPLTLQVRGEYET
jgi:hypothetical protein